MTHSLAWEPAIWESRVYILELSIWDLGTHSLASENKVWESTPLESRVSGHQFWIWGLADKTGSPQSESTISGYRF